jgi:exodeoxyribonuclease V alpha subunit
MTGQVRTHPVYGEQIHVASCQTAKPADGLLTIHLKTDSSYRGFGLGSKKIDNLNERFGSELGAVLESGDVALLSQVLPPEMAERLVEMWRAQGQAASLIAFLDEHGIDVRLAGKIFRYWKGEAVEKLRENPYRLLILTSWEATDRVARRLGIEFSDPRRLIAATEAWLYRRLDRHKDTLVDEQNLKRGVQMLLGRRGEHLAQDAIDLSLMEGAITGNTSSGYQTVGCAEMEESLAARFEGMTFSNQIRASLSLIDAQLNAFQQQERMSLNKRQCTAVLWAVTLPLSVLTGGAGVGKTTVLKAVHRVAKALNVTVYQMALAGRAAQRMREATGEDAYTIIGFLNRIRNGKLLPKAGDLVIIDESSMLDLILTYNLMKVLPHGIRLLFVGDPYQLPPIGPGLIFHVLANGKNVEKMELTEVHRQAASTGIPQAADQVRRGILPQIAEYGGVGIGISFIESREEFIIPRLKVIMRDLGGFHEAQILGVTRQGLAGVKAINEAFHTEMTCGQSCLPDWGLAETDPVIFTINDYGRELFNGSLGRVKKVFTPDAESEGAERRAVVDFDEREIDFTDADLGSVELAYAITVHKAQGSQFKRVVIPITKSRLLDRTLIYTALTRGVEQVVFVGDRRAFEEAVVNPPSASLRRVGFSI